jgi:hypothetical protein
MSYTIKSLPPKKTMPHYVDPYRFSDDPTERGLAQLVSDAEAERAERAMGWDD